MPAIGLKPQVSLSAGFLDSSLLRLSMLLCSYTTHAISEFHIARTGYLFTPDKPLFFSSFCMSFSSGIFFKIKFNL